MNETTNTNNPELINKIHKEYMYYNTDISYKFNFNKLSSSKRNSVLKKSFETSVNKATE